MCDLIVTCNRVFKRVTRVPGSFIIVLEDQIKCDYYNYLLVPEPHWYNNILFVFIFCSELLDLHET